MDCNSTPSPALLDANRLLLERRQKEQGLYSSSEKRPFSTAAPWEEDATLSTVIEGLPAHLGWSSQATTHHLRHAQWRRDKSSRTACLDTSWCAPPTADSPPRTQPKPQPLPALNPLKGVRVTTV